MSVARKAINSCVAAWTEIITDRDNGHWRMGQDGEEEGRWKDSLRTDIEMEIDGHLQVS